jgi:translation initiation factor IF-2
MSLVQLKAESGNLKMLRRPLLSGLRQCVPLPRPSLGVVAVRHHSMADHGKAHRNFVDGEVKEGHTSKNNRRKLNPATMAHYVKANIQESRREQGLTEITDWSLFAESAVYIPSQAGALWVGEDDPRAQKYMTRRDKLREKPGQVKRFQPSEDTAVALESHPLRAYFSTPVDLKDPLSISEGLYKTGQIKEYDVKFNASKLKWVERPPIVTIMGHVDHGKTTLLDYLRNTQVAAGEAGGITQSIGAFSVTAPNGEPITFIDTPGHKAFSEMRKAGAKSTDMVILIVSTVDGVQPQTIEVIELVKELHLPLIVAANKIDRNGNTQPVQDALRKHGVEFEEDGGDTLFVPISALEGTNVPDLLDIIQLQASMLELVTPQPCRAEVMVIDSAQPDGRLVTGIVRCGSLKPGMVLASGMTYAKVVKILDTHGLESIRNADVCRPVLMQGFKMLPKPGTILFQLTNERHGKNFNDLMREVYKVEGHRESYLQVLNAESKGNIYNRKPDNNNVRMMDSTPYNLVVKAGTFGQLQALLSLLYELPTLDGVHLYLRECEVGGVSDHDLMSLSGPQQPGAFLCFGDVTNSYHMDLPSFLKSYKFQVVYHGVQWVKEQMVKLMPKIIEERIVSSAACTQLFRASQAGVGNAAGVEVHRGTMASNAAVVRVMRVVMKGEEMEKVYEGRIKELRRFKDVVPSVEKGLECGVILRDEFVFRVGDVVQEVEKYEVERDVEAVFEEAAEQERRRRASAVAADEGEDAVPTSSEEASEAS